MVFKSPFSGEEPYDEPLEVNAKDPSSNLSPKQLLQLVQRLGFGLEYLGLKRGDVAMILAPNQMFVPVAYIGIVCTGCCFSAVNPAYTAPELLHQITNTTTKLILVHPRSRGAAYQWPELSPSESKNTVAPINYSSGTTGLPKGVCVSHANIIANNEQTMHIRYAGRPYPLKHGLRRGLRAHVYVMSEFRYEEFLHNIWRYRITSLQGGASNSSHAVQATRDGALRSLKGDLWRNTCSRGYKDDSGSVGQLDPNTEAKFVDNDGKEVGVGERGELYVRRPQVCMRYWRNEAATKESLDAVGWLKSGDVAICNNVGFFWIVDREKAPPAELEGVLPENEHVADAAAVGITIRGEEAPRAYVVIHETSKGKVTPRGIQEWIKTRVAKHKYLTEGVVLIDEVPKLQSGKIQRKL
ncbi:4-coumarate-CoA ligase [Xylariaceae sp. FL0255]|nr:4-coumarate-CoA ligase [Xylariaceae sp. FL0255]